MLTWKDALTRRKKNRTSHVACWLLLSCIAFSGCGEEKPAAEEYHAYQTPCRFELAEGIKEGQDVICGDFEFPQDHLDQNASSTLEVHFALFRKDLTKRTDTAMVVVLGGPGQSWQSTAAMIDANLLAAVSKDVLIVEQRGVGQSKPIVACDDVDEGSNLVDAVKACAAELQSDEIALQHYTSWQMALDIDAARVALGYSHLDVVGFSFGTEVALEMLRRVPETLRSVILDSATSWNTDEFANEYVQRYSQLEACLVDCESDNSCQEHFGAISSKFSEVVVRLGEIPLTLGDISMGPNEFVEVLSGVLDEAPYRLPLVVEWAWQSVIDGAEVSPALTSLAEAALAPDSGTAGNVLAINRTCAANPSLAQLDMTSVVETLHPVLQPYATLEFEIFQTVCAHWPTWEAPVDVSDPIRNDTVPVLVLQGEFDFRTPASSSEHIVEHLGMAQRLVFPRLGHTPYASDPTGCAQSIALDFLSAPDKPVDSSCIANLPGYLVQ